MLYRTLDLSVLSNRLIVALAVVGVLAAGAVALRRRFADAACIGAAFLSPVLVLAAGVAVAFLTRIAHIPVHGNTSTGGLNRTANEDYSAFGPLGALAFLSVPFVTAGAYRARRADARQLALALALPGFLILLALQSNYTVFLTRFLLVPAALTAPLFGRLFRTRDVGAGCSSSRRSRSASLSGTTG